MNQSQFYKTHTSTLIPTTPTIVTSSPARLNKPTSVTNNRNDLTSNDHIRTISNVPITEPQEQEHQQQQQQQQPQKQEQEQEMQMPEIQQQIQHPEQKVKIAKSEPTEIMDVTISAIPAIPHQPEHDEDDDVDEDAEELFQEDFPWEDMTAKLQMAAQRMVEQDQVIFQNEGIVSCMNQLIDSLKAELTAVTEECNQKDAIIEKLTVENQIDLEATKALVHRTRLTSSADAPDSPSTRILAAPIPSITPDKPNVVKAKLEGAAVDLKSFLYSVLPKQTTDEKENNNYCEKTPEKEHHNDDSDVSKLDKKTKWKSMVSSVRRTLWGKQQQGDADITMSDIVTDDQDISTMDMSQLPDDSQFQLFTDDEDSFMTTKSISLETAIPSRKGHDERLKLKTQLKDAEATLDEKVRAMKQAKFRTEALAKARTQTRLTKERMQEFNEAAIMSKKAQEQYSGNYTANVPVIAKGKGTQPKWKQSVQNEIKTKKKQRTKHEKAQKNFPDRFVKRKTAL